MIKNIALVVMSVMFVAYGVERHYYINNVEDQIMGMYAKEAVKDSLMKDSTIRALQMVLCLE